ncbi:MAG: phospholipid carrier-dependent glycosyltransferase [Chloroflexota bacterium]
MVPELSTSTPAWFSQHKTLVSHAVAVVALLLFFFLALSSLVDDSPTIDEQNHIARGLAFLRTGDPRLSLEHPPLINALSALPLLTMPELRLPTDHPSWDRPEGWYEFADLFLWQYNEPYVDQIVFLARMPIVFITIALALTGFVFAQLMWGRMAALFALTLFLFEPNLLAHGRYATTDIGGVLFTFLTTLLLWRLWQSGARWSWRGVLGAGLAMGLAFGSKLSALGFVPIWLLLAVLPIYPTNTEDKPVASISWLRRVGWRFLQVIVAGMISILVVWAIFGFQWGVYETDGLLGFLSGITGPAPTYVEGVNQILRLTGNGGRPSFLLGHFSDTGFISYFPVAFAVKTPLALLALIVLAGIALLLKRPTRRSAVFLLVTAVSFYVLTMLSALNIGYRHVLPALPYLLVLVSGLTSPQLVKISDEQPSTWRDHIWQWVVTGGMALMVAATLWIHPHYLSFFNRLVGGPENGYNVLIDSNLDWGQDMIRLRSWMEENDVPSVNLAWFGTADPSHYGITYTALPGLGRDEFFQRWWDVPFDRDSPAPGIYAISASNLQEMPLREDEKTVFAWFRAREPDDRIGYSILIYDVH